MIGFSEDGLINDCEEMRSIVDEKMRQFEEETGSLLEAYAEMDEWLADAVTGG